MKKALNSGYYVQWNQALQSEYDSLSKNETWDLVPRPCDVNVVGNRWIFKVKCKSDESIDRFKARLVGCPRIQSNLWCGLWRSVLTCSTVLSNPMITCYRKCPWFTYSLDGCKNSLSERHPRIWCIHGTIWGIHKSTISTLSVNLRKVYTDTNSHPAVGTAL